MFLAPKCTQVWDTRLLLDIFEKLCWPWCAPHNNFVEVAVDEEVSSGRS